MGSEKRLSEQVQPLLTNLDRKENNTELFPTIAKKRIHKRAPFINRELRKEDLK